MKVILNTLIFVLCFTSSSQCQDACQLSQEVVYNTSFNSQMSVIKSKVELIMKDFKNNVNPAITKESRTQIERDYANFADEYRKILVDVVSQMTNRKTRKIFINDPSSIDEIYEIKVKKLHSSLNVLCLNINKETNSQFTAAGLGLQEVTIVVAIVKELYTVVSQQIKIKREREEMFYKSCFMNNFVSDSELKPFEKI